MNNDGVIFERFGRESPAKRRRCLIYPSGSHKARRVSFYLPDLTVTPNQRCHYLSHRAFVLIRQLSLSFPPSLTQLRNHWLPQLDGPTLTTQGTDKRCPFTAKFGRKRNLDGQDAPQRLKATLLQGETAYRRPPALTTTIPRGSVMASGTSISSRLTGRTLQPQALPSSRYVEIPGV